MKYLIVLILSFSAYANFIKKEQIGVCENVSVFSSALSCQGDCIKVETDYNCETHVIEKKKVDNLESPIYSKNQINKCGEYCETLFPDLVCEDTEETPILNTDLEEIYCTKITGYDQVESDEDIVVVGQEKKDLYDAKMIKKKNKESRIAKGKDNRLRCQKALELIGGTFDSDDESVTDQLEIDFAEINKALEKNRRGEALRLVKAKEVPETLSELKQDIIEILEI